MITPEKAKVLTDKQQQFCQEYIVDFNASAAYVRAGYSPKGSNALASRMIAKDSIKAEIKRLKADLVKETEVDGQLLRDIYLGQARLYNKRAMDDDAAVISSDRRDCAKIATDNADRLAKNIGFFEADNVQSRPQTLIVTGLDRLAELDAERRLILESEQSDLAIDGDVTI